MGHRVNRGFNLLLYSAAPLLTLVTWSSATSSTTKCRRWRGLIRWYVWSYLELFGVVFEQEIDGIQWPAFLQEPTFGGIFNHALGRGTWPSTLNWIIVSDDFEPSTIIGIT